VTVAPLYERMAVEEAGQRPIQHLVTKGRKASTTVGYESYLRVHVAPFFGEKPIGDISKDDIEEFVALCLDNDQSIKSTRNYLGFLHSVFDFALRKGWVVANPCKAVDKPEAAEEDQDIRFLDQAELDALLAATAGPRSRRKPGTAARVRRVRRLRDGEKMPWKRIAAELGVAESTAIYLYGLDLDEEGRADPLIAVERVLYVTAAMTGMRQGELLALRWMDVDWMAHRVRVRRNFVRGKFGTPKSKRSSRSIPLADDVARELELLCQASSYQTDEDLVFAHPHSGNPIDRSRLLKRFKAALERAGVREIRFHDLRHTFGTRMAAGRADAHAPGVDGAPRLQDDADLRRLRAGRERGRARQRRIRPRRVHQFVHQFEQNREQLRPRIPSKYGGEQVGKSPGVRLWSRRSGVRVPSLTSFDPP